jgi:hypothetical protein
MPIVVRELVIRARVDEVAGNGSNGGPARPAAESGRIRDAEFERIVALCVEKVMDNIRRGKER